MKMLTHLEIKKLSSSYIDGALKDESWQIDSIQVEGSHLAAFVSVNSTYLSSTDENQFHVSTFIMFEFVSQLIVIFTHLLAGYTKKTKEVWLAEVHMRSIRPIRNIKNISVKIDLVTKRQYHGGTFFIFEIEVRDDQDGLSTYKFKVQLA